MEKLNPSQAFVGETCRSACKMMKGISRQLLTMSASYERLDLEESSQAVYKSLETVVNSLHTIQESLSETALQIKKEMGSEGRSEEDIEQEENEFPEKMVITKDEYEIMNNIFILYTSGIMNSEHLSA